MQSFPLSFYCFAQGYAGAYSFLNYPRVFLALPISIKQSFCLHLPSESWKLPQEFSLLVRCCATPSIMKYSLASTEFCVDCLSLSMVGSLSLMFERWNIWLSSPSNNNCLSLPVPLLVYGITICFDWFVCVCVFSACIRVLLLAAVGRGASRPNWVEIILSQWMLIFISCSKCVLSRALANHKSPPGHLCAAAKIYWTNTQTNRMKLSACCNWISARTKSKLT